MDRANVAFRRSRFTVRAHAGSIATAIRNAGDEMDKSVSLWRNSYFVKIRRFWYTFNTCCDGARTRDDAFTWFKDIIQYMVDLIEIRIRRDSIVCRKLSTRDVIFP